MMQQALGGLARRAQVARVSAVYETDPIGPPQPLYLNAAALLAWDASPAKLLALLLEVEQSLGRERREKWGPRTIDLDLLWLEGVAVSQGGLVVPHERLLERPFALLPMLEVAPGAQDPATSAPYAPPEPAGMRPFQGRLHVP